MTDNPIEPTFTPAMAAAAGRSLAFHSLHYLQENDEVTVGPIDQGPFIVLPVPAAELLRKLESGLPTDEAAAWYQNTYGESVDVPEFVRDLDELGFLHNDDEPIRQSKPVRWQRLGKMVFSPLVGLLYILLMAIWIAAMIRHPVLAPHPHNIFFTRYLTVISLAMFAGQLPLVFLHEAAHALAGRRLGLPSTLSVSRRFYFVVFQTTMDGLVAVPRRKRALPILAGMLLDMAMVAALTLFAAALRRGDGTLPLVAAFALTLAYATALRLIWQCWFFLETDLYYLIVTVLGCVDLQATARQFLRNWIDRRMGRPATHDADSWHPRDRDAARWYAPLIATGYVVLTVTLCTGLAPMLYQFAVRDVANLRAGSMGSLLDGAGFLLLAISQLAFAGWLRLRESRSGKTRSRRPGGTPALSTSTS